MVARILKKLLFIISPATETELKAVKTKPPYTFTLVMVQISIAFAAAIRVSLAAGVVQEVCKTSAAL